MLLGIPGDNTYSNYQEANRTFWRQTVLPVVNRTAKALSAWLSPAYDATLDLRPDLDAIEALSPEREALWTRLENSTFLTRDEKRAAVGYAPLGDTTSHGVMRKYRPDQARDDRGRWEDEGQDAGSDTQNQEDRSQPQDAPIRLAQVGGAASMTDTGQQSVRAGYHDLVAPQGSHISTFTVDSSTNNTYVQNSPANPLTREIVDVTGWSAYYGPPGTRIGQLNGGWTEAPEGVIVFVRPDGGRSIARPVFPGS